MFRLVTLVLLILAFAGTASAQNHRQPPPGGLAPISGDDSLRLMIQERFARLVQTQLGLTNAQVSRMRSTVMTWTSKRRNLELEERDLRQALADQMRPGVAADQDSVARLTDELLELRVQQVQTYRDELKEMTYLSPVQRAQFFILRDRLLRQIERAREDTLRVPLRRRLRQ
jgi:regulator of replication initiation timing